MSTQGLATSAVPLLPASAPPLLPPVARGVIVCAPPSPVDAVPVLTGLVAVLPPILWIGPLVAPAIAGAAPENGATAAEESVPSL